MTKKFVTASLFVFWAFVVIVGVTALVRYDSNKSGQVSNNANNVTKGNLTNINDTTSSGVTNSSNPLKLTQEIVAKHASSNDCWVIVKDNVYNLTSFMNQHSGGRLEIAKYCGKDGTNAFLTKDQNPAKNHKSGDLNIISNFKIGAINQSVDTTILQQVNQQTIPTSPTGRGGYEDLNDD